ncbi:MAG: ribonuclease HI family protein [Candidatus Levyibacteriota bacterium]
MKVSKISIFADGGARGNPGPSAIGFYIEGSSGEEIISIGKKIGIATNNVAEYTAILEALDWICQNKEKIENNAKLDFYLDSQLASSQLSGLYKVKNSKLRELIFSIRQKEAELGIDVSYNHIPREKNEKADKLVNLALDNLL